MLRYFRFTEIFLMLLLPVFCGCRQHQKVGPEMKLVFGNKTVSVSSAGGTVDVSYEYEGDNLDLAEIYPVSDSWVNSCKFERDGFLSIEVNPNDTGEERRTVIVFYYGSDRVEIGSLEILQSGDTFTINISGVTQYGVEAEILSCSEELTYIIMSIEKAYYDEIGDDNQLFVSVRELYQMYADASGMTLRDFLLENDLLYKGVSQFKLDGLTPESDYYLFAVGMSLDGEMLTELVKVPYRTLDLEMIDASFEMKYTVDGPKIEVSVKPDDNVSRYYVGLADKKYYESTGMDIESFAQSVINDEIENAKGLDVSAAVEKITVAGEYRNTYDLESESEYILYAFTVNDHAYVNSEVSYETIKTGKVNPSGNTFKITVSNVTSNSADYFVSVTTPDPYVILADVAANWAGMTDDQIFQKLTSDLDLSRYARVWDEEGTFEDLLPETEYCVMVFGFDSGSPTTDMVKYTFVTLAE